MLERIFSTTHLLIAYLERDFNFLRVNLAYTRAENRDPGYYSGKNYFTVHPDDDLKGLFQEVIRSGEPRITVPVFLPMRITDELCDMLQKYHPFWMNIHVNHANEITAELAEACDRLTRAGIPLGNQAVLLAGVNDNVHIQRELVHKLVRIRVRPYYLYQCDLVEGAGHFRTPVAKGIEIIEGLRGHTSGFAVPQVIVDAPGGGGKIPVSPNYLISMSDHKIILRNYEGYISAYEEPIDYAPEKAARWASASFLSL